jgi:riboflavin kinase/FMN adenylyltransferase
MRLLHAPTELQAPGRPVCLAIGFFDGVHIGHQQVIRQTLAEARPTDAITLVVTFDRHPNSVVAPDRVPSLLYSLAQKTRQIASLGVDASLVIHFDREFSLQPGEQFIRGLARDLGSIRSICVGATFTFGHKRGGNLALLRRLGDELQFAAHGLPAVSLDGSAVSSTRIRDVVAAGDLATAARMLGRSYSLAGPVVEGDRLGRQLGFPTANIDVAGLVRPPNGVYAVHAWVAGVAIPAVVNIGFRPTLRQAQPQLRVEAHLLDFDQDLYGRELELTFVTKLREEKQFGSLAGLREQIATDVVAARTVLRR